MRETLIAFWYRNWFCRWLWYCSQSFKSYRRSAQYQKKEAAPVPVEKPKEEVLPPPGVPCRPKLVEQSSELQEAVGKALYGVRNPSKKLSNVKVFVNYEDGTKDVWSCNHQVGVHMEHDSRTSTITLTSLED